MFNTSTFIFKAVNRCDSVTLKELQKSNGHTIPKTDCQSPNISILTITVNSEKRNSRKTEVHVFMTHT